MKHLATFNESTNPGFPEDILQDLKDICLELKDIGFQIKTGRYVDVYKVSKNIDCIRIYKYDKVGHYDTFNYNTVKEYIDRIKDYMKMNGYATEVCITRNENLYKSSSQITVKKVRLRFNRISKQVMKMCGHT